MGGRSYVARRTRAQWLSKALVGCAVLGAALASSGSRSHAQETVSWERVQDIPQELVMRLQLDGDRMIALRIDLPSCSPAQVLVYERSGPEAAWAQAATIEPPPGQVFAKCTGGETMAISGARIAVQTYVLNGPGSLDDREKVAVYDRDPVSGAWVLTALLDPVGPAVFHLDLDGDRVTFVSHEAFCVTNEPVCPPVEHPVSVEGWQRSASGTWERTLELTTQSSQFPSTSMDRGRLVVRHRPGTLRVFDPDPSGVGWVEQAVLSGEPGSTVAVDGDRFVVHGEGDNEMMVYERGVDGAWALAAIVAEPAGGWGSPMLLTLEGDTLGFITAYTAGDVRPNLWVYERDNAGQWVRASVPLAPVGKALRGVGLDGSTLVTAWCCAVLNGSPEPDAIRSFTRLTQVDTDGDGVVDRDDPDDDNDGIVDGDDAFPTDPGESVDTDGDGVGDNEDPDDDGDGLPDEHDGAPHDSDADDDGVPDGRDVEHIQALVAELPGTALTAPGHRRSLTAQLDQVEALVLAGNPTGAAAKLSDLRRHLDGCGATADNNDWVRDCTAQGQLRALIDLLVAELT